MFRRKEGDEVTTGSPTGAPASANGASSSETVTSATTATPATATTSTASTAPTASAAAPARSEPAARVPSAPIGNFRPSPIAEFNRSATGRTSEPARAPAAATTASSSFGTASDKNASSSKTTRRVLTVGNDILLKGEIATCDRLVIEGRVEAKLSDVHTVEIAECGSFKGTAEVEDAEISGIFEGDLIVRNRIVIYASGEVRGNISYGEIEIERGGKLTGQIKTVGNAASSSKFKTADASASLDVKRKETAAA